MVAETFLAAMIFQILVSRLFEPVDLAAIVATVSFSAVRDSNPYKHAKHNRKVDVDAGDEEAPGRLDIVHLGGPGDGQADGQQQEELARRQQEEMQRRAG